MNLSIFEKQTHYKNLYSSFFSFKCLRSHEYFWDHSIRVDTDIFMLTYVITDICVCMIPVQHVQIYNGLMWDFFRSP